MSVTKPLRRSQPSQFVTFLTTLLLVDVLFIGLYVTRDFLLDAQLTIGFLASDRWLIERDRGFPEFFQYLKTVFAGALLFGLAVRYRSAIYTAWCLVFSYIFVDDASRLHESVGLALHTKFEPPDILGVSSFSYLEALPWGAVGLVAVGLVAYGYLRNHTGGSLSKELMYLIATLFLFAGVVDAAHIYVEGLSTRPSYLLGAVTVLEDGGEMVVLSFITAWVYRHASAASSPRAPRRS